MEDSKTYNGYANYETWSIALFIDNEQALTSDVLEKALAYTNEEWYDFAQWLKDYAHDFLGIETMHVYAAQLLNASLDMVDWRELSYMYIANAKENKVLV
jgi:hypothetical protein